MAAGRRVKTATAASAPGRAEPRRSGVILSWWFGDRPDQERLPDGAMERWFGARPEDDRFIRRHFEPDVDAAVQGRLGNWRRTPRGCVALIILLDQFPRAMYRGSPRAYAQDPKAVGLCLWGLARRMDARLAPLQRAFFYLPLEHAEDLELQRESVRRYARLAEEAPPGLRTALASFDLYARRHYRVIEKFGRFPQRNEILGRTSTAEERDYLRRATAAT